MNSTFLLSIVTASLTTVLSISCKKKNVECDTTILATDTISKMIFQSGYEEGSVGSPEDAILDITGTDNSLDSLSDWTNDLEGDPNIGKFLFYYEDGKTSDRYARIIDEPGNTSNKVLHFWLDKAAISNGVGRKKGRIQSAFRENERLREVYFKQRLFLHPDFELIKNYPSKINWLTIQEFWNNSPGTDEGHVFRVTLNIRKLVSETGELYFGAHGQTQKKKKKWIDVWDATADSYPVPIGEWITIETYILEGDEQTGRFIFTVTPEGGEKTTVLDVTGYTYHPDDPCPNGFGGFNPSKIYTDDNLIDYVRGEGGTLQMYWDDFEIWKNKQP